MLRHRAFVGVVALNTLFIFAGMSGFELLPVYAKNEVGVTETTIGAIFFVNTVVIVLAQLPIAKLSEGHRRMRMLALLGVLWAGCWVAVSLVGGSVDGSTAAVLLGVVMAAFGIGECIHGAVQAPLVSDLAEPRLLGRYMALSALSWQVGFALGPAVGGFLLVRLAARHLARVGCALPGRRGARRRARAGDPQRDPTDAGGSARLRLSGRQRQARRLQSRTWCRRPTTRSVPVPSLPRIRRSIRSAPRRGRRRTRPAGR